MFSAASAASRRSRSKSRMQISGVGPPIHSVPVSVSCTRYSDRWERSRTSGADSANDFSTVQVSWSRQMPTTERGSLFEKFSRGELLSASLSDSGFILHSMVAEFAFCLYSPPFPADHDRIANYPGT